MSLDNGEPHEPALGAIEAIVRDRGIEVLIVDPFIGDFESWAGLASATSSAIMLVAPNPTPGLVDVAHTAWLARTFYGAMSQVCDLKRGGSLIVAL